MPQAPRAPAPPPLPRPAGPDARPFHDADADRFEGRKGLSPELARLVADAVLEHHGSSGRLLDIGPGPSLLALELAGRAAGYRALERSPRMVALLLERAAADGLAAPEVTLADAAAPWPDELGPLDVVFGSRSLHWVEPAHLIAEARRLAGPRGVALLIGRFERDGEGLSSALRGIVHAELARDGLVPRSGADHAAALVSHADAAAGARLAPRRIATRDRTRTLSGMLEEFRGKAGLAGVALDAAAHHGLVERIARRAAAELGPLEEPHTERETYVLDGIRLPSAGSGDGVPRA